MTTSRQKAIGSQAERDVAMRMHGERIGGYGPADVRAPLVGYHQLQVKRLSAAPSLNAIRAMLARIPYKSTQLRGGGRLPAGGGSHPAHDHVRS